MTKGWEKRYTSDGKYWTWFDPEGNPGQPPNYKESSPMPYQRRAEPSKGNFLKWEAGESKDLVILSEEPTKSHIHFVEGQSADCDGEGCALCAKGVRRSIRWAVLVKCEGEETPWEMSNTTFFGVEDVAEMATYLSGLRLRVTRHGTGMKTRYSVLPITGEEKEPEEKRNLAWFAREIKRLCALDNMDPGQELKLFLSKVAPHLVNTDEVTQMQAFYNYIDKETKDLQHTDEPPPDEAEDIGRYF